MTTITTRERVGRAPRHPLADPRHRRRGGHRRRLRRRLLGLEPGLRRGRSRRSRSRPWIKDLGYGVWLMPAILAPLIIRKPGAAIFAEMVAAGLSALLGSTWGPDVLLSGFLQGAAAELVFAFTLYRSYGVITLVLAAVASALAAFVHDWVIWYPDRRPDDPDPPRHRDGRLGRASSPRVARSSWPARCAGPASWTGSRTDHGGGGGAASRRRAASGPRGSGSPTGAPTGRRSATSRSSVAPGACLLVVGPSGSGKSTLGLAIAGLIPRDIPGEVARRR